MTLIRGGLMGFWLILLCAVMGMTPVHAAQSIPPNVGKYSYGFIRCDVWHDGQANRSEDETAGANYYYNSGCGASVSYAGPWATATSPQGGVCGGDDQYPGTFLGVEFSNHTNDSVTYNYGSDCSGSSQDGMSIRRTRLVSCPWGYTANPATNLCDPPAGIDPNKNNDTCPAGCNGSDPINSATGALLQDEADYVDPNGLLSLTRYYSSASGQPLDSQLGSQWRANFDQSIGVSNSGGVTAATAYRSSGDRLAFVLTAGVWKPDADVHMTLSSTQDASGNYTAWTLITEDGTIESYNGDGALVQTVDRQQRKLTYSYNGIYVAKVTDDHGRSLSFIYSTIIYNNNSYESNRITQITLPDGGAISYGYDSNSGMLTTVTFPPDGSAPAPVRTYVYGENGAAATALTGIVDETNQRSATWTYDANGRATMSVRGAAADLTERTELTYAADGMSSTVKNYSGSTSSSSTSRTLAFNVVQGVAHLGSSSATVALPSSPRLPKSQTFDTGGQPLTQTDFNGSVSKMTYDANELQTQLVEASGKAEQRTTKTTWDARLRLPLTRTIKNASGKVLQAEGWAYNTAGQVTARCLIDQAKAPSYVCAASGTAPAGVRRTTTSYCTAVDTSTCPLVGLALVIDGPRTDVTDRYTYAWYTSTDESGCATLGGACHRGGDLKSVTDGVGLVTTMVSYDKAGRLTRTKASNGVITDRTYTARGWLATSVIPALPAGTPSGTDATTRITYNANGTVQQVKDADGVITTYTYDAASRLTDLTDGGGRRFHYTLDALGNRIKTEVITAAGTVVLSSTQGYNTLGQLISITDGLGRATFTAGAAGDYDANGNLVHSTDGLGVQRKQAFDGLNRLVSTLENYQGADTATNDAQHLTALDAADRVTSQTDPDGMATTFNMDAFGNVSATHSPDTGITSRLFDLAGNTTSSTDAKSVTRAATYDASNRPLSDTYADTTLNVQYKYDDTDATTGCTGGYGNSHLTRIIEGNGGTIFCYNRFGHVIRKTQAVGSLSRTTNYGWSLANRLASMTTANGTLIAYTRDTLGHITSIKVTPENGTATTVVSNVVYKSFGPIASFKLGSGQTVTYTYDLTGAVTDVTGAGLTLHLRRDAMGKPTAIGPAAGVPTATETYSYDPLYRLTGVQAASGSVIAGYTYNKTGDRLSKTGQGILTGSYAYRTGTHQLIGVGTTTRTVDANGNTTAESLASGTYAFGYNQRQRLTLVQKDGATVATYGLDARGERVQKTVGGQLTSFDYDESSQLISEATGTSTRDYIWLEGIPVAIVDGTGTSSSFSYVSADALGTPRAVTNTSGTVVWQWPYASNTFGESQPSSSTGFVLNLRFPGQYFDSESNLNYNIHRDYEPAAGRYVQSDPIGLRGGDSTYAYSQSNPLVQYDPLGLFTLSDDFRGSGGVWCDHGTWRIYVQVPSAYAQCPIVGECAAVHEQSHMNDANRVNPGLCHFWNPTLGGQWLAASDDAEFKDTESRAFAAELACLEAWLKKQQCKSGDCNRLVQFRIDDIRNIQLPNVEGGTYGQ